jgi:methylthioribose-1-phosphate isomerase
MPELAEAGVRARLIADSMAAFAMRRLGVDGVFVGADRIAANGDTANKVGSYGLALAAKAHGVPFRVVAPLSTIDPACPDGEAIPIEERDGAELLGHGSCRWAPRDAATWNPAFDVVPADLIQDIVTEAGLLRAPFAGSIRDALDTQRRAAADGTCARETDS